MTKIIVSGLTAAGKTTHARLLASQLGYEYVGASQLMAQELAGSDQPWDPGWDSRRLEGQADRVVDELMVREFERRDDCVFDAWALPWTTNGPATRLWLASDLGSRSRKVIVSRLERGQTMSYAEAEEIAVQKDQFSRDMFQRLHGFDLFTDHAIFDIVLDNSEVIPVASLAAAAIGISAFAPVVLAAVVEHAGVPMPARALTKFQLSMIQRS